MARPLKFPKEADRNPTVEALLGVVSINSWHYEEDRTDLHDNWSLCWLLFCAPRESLHLTVKWVAGEKRN